MQTKLFAQADGMASGFSLLRPSVQGTQKGATVKVPIVPSPTTAKVVKKPSKEGDRLHTWGVSSNLGEVQPLAREKPNLRKADDSRVNAFGLIMNAKAIRKDRPAEIETANTLVNEIDDRPKKRKVFLKKNLEAADTVKSESIELPHEENNKEHSASQGHINADPLEKSSAEPMFEELEDPRIPNPKVPKLIWIDCMKANFKTLKTRDGTGLQAAAISSGIPVEVLKDSLKLKVGELKPDDDVNRILASKDLKDTETVLRAVCSLLNCAVYFVYAGFHNDIVMDAQLFGKYEDSDFNLFVKRCRPSEWGNWRFDSLAPMNEQNYGSKTALINKATEVVNDRLDEAERVEANKRGTTDQILAAQLHSRDELNYNFEIVRSAGDGNCLFHSLLSQFGLDINNNHQLIRQDICTGMEVDESLVMQNKTVYLDKMRRNGTYGGHLEIVTFGKIFLVNITVYEENQENKKVNKITFNEYGGNDRPSIYLKLSTWPDQEGWNHYDSLRPINSPMSFMIDDIGTRLENRLEYYGNVETKVARATKVERMQTDTAYREIDCPKLGECTFQALCLAMECNEDLYDEMRKLLWEESTDEDIDRYCPQLLNKTFYGNLILKKRKLGGDFEIRIFARLAKCKIHVFNLKHPSASYYEKQIFESSYGNTFSLHLKRLLGGKIGHMTCLIPNKKEFRVDQKAFAEASRRLNDALIQEFLGREVVRAEGKSEARVSPEDPANNTYSSVFKIYEFLNRRSNSLLMRYLSKWRKLPSIKNDDNEDDPNHSESDGDEPISSEIKRSNCKIVRQLMEVSFEETGNLTREGYGYLAKKSEKMSSDDLKTETGIKNFTSFEKICSMIHEKVSDIKRSEELSRQIGENILIKADIPFEDFINELSISLITMRSIGPCVCIKCSGKNSSGKIIFRVFNSLFDLRDHSRMHHDRCVPGGSVLNLTTDDSHGILCITSGQAKTFWLVRKDEYDPTLNPKPVPKAKTLDQQEKKLKPTKTEKNKPKATEKEKRAKSVPQKGNKMKQKDISNDETENSDEAKPMRSNGKNSTNSNSLSFLEPCLSFSTKEKNCEFMEISKLNRHKGNKSEVTRAHGMFDNVTLLSKVINDWARRKDHEDDDRLMEFRESLPKNILSDMEIDANDIYSRYKIKNRTLMAIGPCLDLECSGLNEDGNMVWRVFNSLFEYRKHLIKSKHTISDGCLVRFEKPDGYSYLKKTKGNIPFQYMMRDIDIPLLEDEHESGDSRVARNAEEASHDSGYVNIVGNNITTACSYANKELLNRFLEKEKTDFMMLNESGRIHDKILRDKEKFGYLNKGTRTATIFNKDYKLSMILEKLNDEYNQIMMVTSDQGRKLILYNVYIPPSQDHSIRLATFITRLKVILDRYVGAKVVVFGDFNLSRDEMSKKVMDPLKGRGVKLHKEDGINAFTRCRVTETRVESSYLDYFVTVNIEVDKFEVFRPFARSDHWALRLRIRKEELGDLSIKKSITYDFNKSKKDAQEIYYEFLDALCAKDQVFSLTDLVGRLRTKYKPRLKKKRELSFVRDKVEKFLSENKLRNKEEWNTFTNFLKRVSNEEYNSFLYEIDNLRATKQIKEYFLRLRFYSEISSNVGIMRNLEVEPDEGDENAKVITDKLEIDDRVSRKYKAMFLDKGSKNEYSDDVARPPVRFLQSEIANALEAVSLDKATSWDYLPGEVFKLIVGLKKTDPDKYSQVCGKLTDLYNTIVNSPETIPEELMCSRLLCLNKVPGENGKLENIRPIAINGTLVKILEKAILTRLEVTMYVEKKTLNVRQVGFVPGLGCDVDIMRLRVRCDDVMKIYDKDEKFLLFVDLKNAYDCVNHRRLFDKLKNKGFDEAMIRVINKIYSSARMKLNLLGGTIYVNRGVLQGSIISPMLFNLYIDDLIEDLSNRCFEVLAYADDLAIICRNRAELVDAMSALEEWSASNGIGINKAKSGILILKNPGRYEAEIGGYPVKKTYKYLGVKLDSKLSPLPGLIEVNSKLSIYLKRNNWLIKKHFSPRSLTLISDYYQKSRLVYGMSSFLDDPYTITQVERHSVQYTKSVLGLKNCVNSRRIRLALGRPKVEHLLWLLLRKNLDKYERHFGTRPALYLKVDQLYTQWLRKGKRLLCQSDISRMPYSVLKLLVEERSLEDAAADLKVEVGDKFRESIRRNWFKFPDKRDALLIKYLVNYGFFNPRFVPNCEWCGGANSRRHITNDCLATESLRYRTTAKIRELTGIDGGDLEWLVLKIYLSPTWENRVIVKLAEEVKRFVASLFINFSKK